MVKVLIVMAWLLGAAILWMVWEIIKFLFKPLVIIVTRDNGLRLVRKSSKDGMFDIGDGVYPEDADAVIPDKGKLFWRRIFVFDEGSAKPRIIQHRKDVWLSNKAIKKVINDEHIKAMSSKILEDKDKAMIYLAAICSVVNLCLAIFIALKTLGFIK